MDHKVQIQQAFRPHFAAMTLPSRLDARIQRVPSLCIRVSLAKLEVMTIEPTNATRSNELEAQEITVYGFTDY